MRYWAIIMRYWAIIRSCDIRIKILKYPNNCSKYWSSGSKVAKFCLLATVKLL